MILLSPITLNGFHCTTPKHGSSSLNQLQFEFMTLIMFVLQIIDVLFTQESLNGFSNW